VAFTIIPGVHGFGTETCTAGRGSSGSDIIHVTNTNASGSGSLEAAIESGGADKTIVFDVSGVIDMRSGNDIFSTSDNVRVAGQTAPSPGITVLGVGLLVRGVNFIAQHIRFRPGDDPAGPNPDNRDALSVIKRSGFPAPNLVIFDHCSFSWSIDEVEAIFEESGTVHHQHCLFNSALFDSLHPGPEATHGFGPIIGGGGDKIVSYSGCIFASLEERMPLSRGSSLVVNNCIFYHADKRTTQLGSDSDVDVIDSISGNIYVRGSNSPTTGPISIVAGANPFTNSDRVYLENNRSLDHTPQVPSDQWAVLIDNDAGVTRATVELVSRPAYFGNLGDLEVKDPTLQSTVDWIIDNAGARPNDRGGGSSLSFSNSSRDTVDGIIINQVTDAFDQTINNRTGQHIDNVVPDGGGWPPTGTVSTQVYISPANPFVVQGSGYTNLEEDLNALDLALEIDPGPSEVVAGPPPIPVANAIYSFNGESGTVTIDGIGSNKLIVVIATLQDLNTSNQLTITLDGVAGTLHGTASIDGGVASTTTVSYFTHSQNPGPGSFTLATTWSGTTFDQIFEVLEYTGADQTTPLSPLEFSTGTTVADSSLRTVILTDQKGRLGVCYATSVDSVNATVSGGHVPSANLTELDEEFETDINDKNRLAVGNDLDIATNVESYSWTVSHDGSATMDSVVLATFAVAGTTGSPRIGNLIGPSGLIGRGGGLIG